MKQKPPEHAASVVDKSTFAATSSAAPPEEGPSFTRRHWLSLALAAGGAAASAEVASLGGAWDHRSVALASPLPRLASGTPDAPRLLHIGHCCHLIELSGQRWLTDPWFFNPAFGSLT